MSAGETAQTAPGPGVSDGIAIRVFARTDVGRLREHNEDDFLVADLTQGVRTLMPEVQTHALGPRGSIFVVCDGMGGAAAGEVASRTAVDTIFERMQEGEPPSGWDDLVSRLDNAIIEAGSRIFKMARSNQERRGMGTTCTAAALIDGRLFAAQVGDSRCYVIRRDRLVRITRDQSLLTQLIEAGQIRAEDASHFEHSNIILQALGTTAMINTDVTYVDLRRGDIIVICSDGLAGMVDEERIREIVLGDPEPIVACRALTDAANAAGGDDNITVIVARFDGRALPEPRDEEPPVFARYPKPRPIDFDHVPYTIHQQLFADGLDLAPRRPDVPAGAVRLDAMGVAPGADTPSAVGTAPPSGDTSVAAAPPPAPPVVQSGAAHAGDAPAAAADPPGAASDAGQAAAIRVLEWSDDEVDPDGPGTPAAGGSNAGLRRWVVAALALLAIIAGLILWESAGCGRGSPAGTAPAAPAAGEAATDATSR